MFWGVFWGFLGFYLGPPSNVSSRVASFYCLGRSPSLMTCLVCKSPDSFIMYPSLVCYGAIHVLRRNSCECRQGGACAKAALDLSASLQNL